MFVIFLAIQTTTVQTYLGHRASEYFSEKLKTKVIIGAVDIDFMKSFILSDVYIEDLHHDTLLYSEQLKMNIRKLDFLTHCLAISNVVARNTKVKYIKYTGEDDFNIQFIIDAFDSGDTTKHSPKPYWDITCDKITLIKSGFDYKNEHDTVITSGVNYFDLSTSDINGVFTDLKIDHDTILATIDYLNAKEKSGFSFQNLSSYVRINSLGVKLNELKIKTAESTIETDLMFNYKRYRDFRDFIHKVKIEAEFNKSTVAISDIAYFAPELKGINEHLIVSGKVSGKVDDLRGKKMDILALGATRFRGDFALTGLPEIEETLIHLNVENLTTSYTDLTRIPLPPFENKKHLELSSNIMKLGKMNFKGTFTGLYNDFYAYGKFNSALGNLSSDLSLRHDYETLKKTYKGKLNSQSFDFGYFFGVKNLGTVTANLDVDGSGLTLEDISAQLKGNISKLIYNNYSYKNIQVEGGIAKQIFQGKLNVKDENVDLDFNGKIDFTQKEPNLDFISTINHANLGALHFINTIKKTSLSTQIYINLTGSNIDNLVGRLNFDNTVYVEDGTTYSMSIFNLIAKEEAGKRSIQLFSDVADAEIKGEFKLLELPESAQILMQKYLPSYFTTKLSSTQLDQNFEYSCTLKKTEAITSLFMPHISISPQSKFDGVFNSINNDFTLKGNASKLIVKGCVFNYWTIDAAATSSNLDFFTNSKRVELSDSLWFQNFNLTAHTNIDSVRFNIAWDNKTSKKNKGDVKAFLHFNPDKSIQFKFLPSQLIISDSTWVIDDNNLITMDTSSIRVNKLMIKHDNQSISANGVLSEIKSDQLTVAINNFDLTNLNSFFEKFDLELKGTIDGETTISDIYNNMIFLSNIKFKKLLVNRNEIGNGEIQSLWDKSKEGIYLNGQFTLGIVPNILFAGYYYPKRNENLDFEINLQALQMQIFEPYVKEYCSSFKGFFAGNINLKGSTQKPLLSGNLDVNAKKITVDYLNTTYKFSHAIKIENNSFNIEDMDVFDINNNKAIVNGKVYHDNFKNFQLDFDINANKFMCLNTSETDNQSFYGRGFVSGYINIFGFMDNILIDANVKTEKIVSSYKADKIAIRSNTEQTKFFIPLSGTAEVNENNFIKFVKKDTLLKNKDNYKVKLGGLTLDFAVEITPDAELQLIFDQKVGDIIKATGRGNIKLKINSRGEFKMYGDYTIDDGDYLFTLQNVINKRFDIENGSTIKWTGVPYDAEVNINAIYKARASLSPFFAADDSNNDKKRHPIDLKLLMTDNLVSPIINFDIVIPQSIDSRVRQEVMGYLSNEAELNRQVFSLLILNSFVTPYQLSNTGGTGPNALNAAGTNSTELLSNQLSNMLSKISNDFDIGVKYRPKDEFTKNEWDLALSTQLFNDKLTIDGNVGANGNSNNPNQTQTQNTTNIVGEVAVDYKITDDGKFRIKAFNKANDNNQVNTNGGYTQGLGVFYREEFDTIGELFKRYLNAISKH